jgi:hypothetical protein
VTRAHTVFPAGPVVIGGAILRHRVTAYSVRTAYGAQQIAGALLPESIDTTVQRACL